MQQIFTIGHSNQSTEEFTEILLEHQIDVVLDVRKLRGSTKFPQFNADTLQQDLAQSNIELLTEPALAGRRTVSKTVPFETNAWWENRSFHNYADYALSNEFKAGLERLINLSADHIVAVMCAEAVWWRCHRRIIADHLIARGAKVLHLVGKNATEAQLSKGAVPGPCLTYPKSPLGHS